MSEINIHQTKFDQEKAQQGEWPIGLAVDRESLRGSYRHGEELIAAYRLLEILDELENGEALVVWRDLF